jgi:integrase
MASVEKRFRGDKVTWLARWRDPDGRQRKKTFRRKVDADRFITVVTADMLQGQYVDPDAGRVLVADYAWEWLKARPHRDSTASRQESLLRNHIENTSLGVMRMSAVRPSPVQAWVSDRARALKPSTLKVVTQLVRSVFAAAVVERVIGVSPVQRITLPRVESPRVVPLSVVQVRALAEAMPAHCRALVLAQAGLGLRLGELLGLQVEDFDFLHRTVHVRRQLARDGKTLVECKTPRSIRDVPLPATVADEIARHLAAYPPRTGFVFTGIRGRPWWHNEYGSRIFQSAVEAAGLPESITTHDLRHHYASVLLAAGESVVAVAERLGHENATLVLTTYGHLLPDSQDRTRRAIDQAWCAPDVPRSGEKGLS